MDPTSGRLALLLLVAAPAAAQSTDRVSIGVGGVDADGASYTPSISADGRLVVFSSLATNLVPADANGRSDVFLHDRQTAVIELVSVDSSGAQFGANSLRGAISANGRFVVFESWSQPAPGNNIWSVFVRDRQAGTTTPIASGLHGVPTPALSADGRFAAYAASETPWSPIAQVFVWDRLSGTTSMISVDPGGAPGDLSSGFPAFSADGRWLAFASQATSLVVGDTNSSWDVFVRDLSAGVTERASLGPLAQQSDGTSLYPSISADGRLVAFESYGTNLVAGDSNSMPDVFVRDRVAGTTVRVSVDSSGTQADQDSSSARISADGRFVAFASRATNLVPSDTNGAFDVFVHDLQAGSTSRASVSTAGTEAGADSNSPAVSADGRVVGFASQATDLVPGDSNLVPDVFVRDLAPGCTSPSAYCTAVANSSGQAASISWSGWASFTQNNFVLDCAGLPGSVTGLFFHGTASIDPGVPFGNGVRCVGGTLHRLGVVQATAGSVSQAQDFGSSAYLGILPGNVRYFELWYRDPSAGGAAFNASNGLAVAFCN